MLAHKTDNEIDNTVTKSLKPFSNLLCFIRERQKFLTDMSLTYLEITINVINYCQKHII